MPGTEVAETAEKTDAARTVDSSSSSDWGSKFNFKEVLKIPCMRSSLLHGYIGAIVGGLVGFFYTSNVRIGAHSAFGSYWVVAAGSWATCRYKLYKQNKLWEDLLESAKESRKIKKDEYNLPVRLQKLKEKTDDSDNKPSKHS